MSKKEIREDTHTWIFAAHLYVMVVGTFVFALGFDIYHAVEALGGTYGS